MSYLPTSSVTEQVAAHLREGILTGRWKGLMPGRSLLARELGVSPTTVVRALNVLEQENLLVSQGAGQRRRILLKEGNLKTPALRIALMLFSATYRASPFMVELRHQLENAGHETFFSDKSLLTLGQCPKSVTRYIKRTDADAWLVSSASREVLSGITGLEKPAFALFGRHVGLPIAGARPDKSPPFASLVRSLVSKRHHRISFLCRRQIRYPDKGKPLLTFLAELEAAGIGTGEYNCPDWEETPDGFIRILDSLFRNSPPTALILDEAYLFHATFHYLAQRGLKVPQDISLFCMDSDPGFSWCRPSVAHIRWDYQPIARRIVSWANNVAKGKADLRQTMTKAKLVDGDTIGFA